ncbi:MAG: DUF2807 domain-containing protein [Aureispira sp.]|nr:DUF2807 domain-containing protein [Aureispira sp.]
MKNLFFLVLATALITFSSCKKEENSGPTITETKDLDAFTGVSTQSCIDANIYYGDQQSVTLTGPEDLLKKVNIYVENGRLIMKMKNGTYLHNQNIVADITIPRIDYVKVTGSGDVWIDQFSNLIDLELTITGSGDIKTGILTLSNDVDSKITGSGQIEIQGSADRTYIEITGSGDYKAFGLKANTCSAEITGSGNVEAYVNSDLDVNISGSGDVDYKGEPTIEVNISGSGEVSNKN